MSRSELAEVSPHLHLKLLADVYDRASEFDVIHSHIDVWTLPFAERSATPSVLTMHGRLDTDYVQEILPLYPEIPLVSVSDSQRDPVTRHRLRWMATVHNGLDLRVSHVLVPSLSQTPVIEGTATVPPMTRFIVWAAWSRP